MALNPLIQEEPPDRELCPIHGCPIYPFRLIPCPECELEKLTEDADDRCSDPVDWSPNE
ncbi:hypothetical protein G1C95_1117 [Bifidobacterium sp. DSM 109957]|uniref:Uncharacterized protein n=1 Tax=Bifidobacterium oedipodis TaxID=2675322 RepID=A0A7Y0HRD4_9BIFI|nr:hypothetical protein [Bifidobacterium sp. DSM 109957]